MSMARRIGVVTGSRAEYGLLYWTLKELAADSALELQLIVTGAHLAPQFGDTVRDIEADGFAIAARVDMLLAADTPLAVSKSMGLCTIGMADAFERLKPDILLVVGDRYEILAAVQAAAIARIPIAHAHGGELTEGSFDDSIRHAITKLAHVHFVAAPPHRRRVIQMGEDPARVHVVGAVGLDSLERRPVLSRAELAKAVGLALEGRRLFAVTYHPVTGAVAGGTHRVEALLAALDQFPDAAIVISGVNADPGNRSIAAALDAFAQTRGDRCVVRASLGPQCYLSLIRHADVVIGNSSSGLIEAPAVGTPTVNLGDRQKGREQAPSVIQCSEDTASIVAAIRRALNPAFKSSIDPQMVPYGRPGAARRIVDALRNLDVGSLTIKRFHDLSHVAG